PTRFRRRGNVAGGKIHRAKGSDAHGPQRVLAEKLHGGCRSGLRRSGWNVNGLEVAGRGPRAADEFRATRFNTAQQALIINGAGDYKRRRSTPSPQRPNAAPVPRKAVG